MTRNMRGPKLLALLILLLSAAVALAERGVFDPKMQPHEIYISTTAVNTAITAEIGADAVNPVIQSSVILYETTAAGSPIGQLGVLYDDGTHGDVIAADGIFTRILPVTEPAPRTRYFKISAAYTGIRNRYLSPVFTLTAYPHMPAQLMPEIEGTVEGLQNSFLANVGLLGLEGARNQALAQALAHPNIGPGNVNLDGSELSLMYVYTDPGTGYVFHIAGLCELDDPAHPSDGFGRSAPVNLPDIYKVPGNGKVLLFGPGYHAPDPQNGIMDHAAALFHDPEYMSFQPDPPTITARENASLEVVKQWGNYGTVIVHTHGGFWTLNATQQVVLRSGTPISFWNLFTYVFDLLSNRIGVSGSGRFVFYPSFITEYVGHMSDTFLYLGACHSLQNDSMWNALKQKGAKVAYGWSEEVDRGFNEATFASLMDPMLPHTNPPDPRSALDAYNAVPSKTDPNPPHATLRMRPTSGDWQTFYFVGIFPLVGTWTGTAHFVNGIDGSQANLNVDATVTLVKGKLTAHVVFENDDGYVETHTETGTLTGNATDGWNLNIDTVSEDETPILVAGTATPDGLNFLGSGTYDVSGGGNTNITQDLNTLTGFSSDQTGDHFSWSLHRVH